MDNHDELNVLQEGLLCHGKRIEFEEREFFNQKMCIWIPKEYTIMPEPMAKAKYPNEQRPQIILTNREGTVNITFSLLEQTIDNNQFNQALQGYKEMIYKLEPLNLFLDESVERNQEAVWGWFDYISYAVDGLIYNMMFIASVNNKLLFGTFNCPYEDFGLWKACALQMGKSICDISENEERFTF